MEEGPDRRDERSDAAATFLSLPAAPGRRAQLDGALQGRLRRDELAEPDVLPIAVSGTQPAHPLRALQRIAARNLQHDEIGDAAAHDLDELGALATEPGVVECARPG